jgi:hypothetical protein
VFRNEPIYIQSPIDFKVSLRGVTDTTYEINVGPRFKPNLLQGFNVTSSPNSLGNSFLDFYSPEATDSSVFLYSFLVKEKRKNEISQYLPLTAFDTDTQTGPDLYLTPDDASGGRFFIEKTGKTLFWMKIPYGYNIGGGGDYEKLSTQWARIEQGTSIPKNSGLKYDESGNLTYTLYIPIFSIEPVGGNMNIKYFDCGSIRYFSDIYKVEQGGKSKDLPFTYDKVSEYYRN